MQKRIFLSLFSLLLLLPVLVFAQTPSQAPGDSSIVPPSNSIILANIDLWDAKILSQDDHTIELSLDIHNGANVQPDIRYLVRLIQYSEDGTVEEGIADEYVYQDVISLNEDETKTKRITYTAPDFFSGLYKLQVIARNTSGMPLGTANFGNVHFQSTLPQVRINSDTCSLTVQGTDGQMDKTPFTLAQGVDVVDGEKLFLTCPAENISKDPATLRPSFTVYERINFGPRIPTAPSQETKEMSPYAKDVLTFEVPMIQKPQSYAVTMTLQEKETNKNVSLSVPFRYVVRGESATIQNVIFDKSFYNKGDTATIKMFWSGSADDFPESRHKDPTDIGALMLKFSITSSDQTLCAKEASQSLDMTSIESKVTVPIEEDCLNPTATLSLINNRGVVLASREVKAESTQQQKADYEQMKSDGSLIPDSFSNIGIVTTLLAAFFILLALLFFVRSRNKGSGTTGTGMGTGTGTGIKIGGKGSMFSFFLILLSSCFFLAPERASAVTWTVPTTQYSSERSTVFTASTNKLVYIFGETLVINGSAEYYACINSIGNAVKLDANVFNSTRTLFYSNLTDGTWIDYGQGMLKNGSVSLTVPTIPSSLPIFQAGQRIVMTGYNYSGIGGTHSGEADLVIFISSPPAVNGGWSAWGTCLGNGGIPSGCGLSGIQTRLCNNPAPQWGGLPCSGPASQSCSGVCLPPTIVNFMAKKSNSVDWTSSPGSIDAVKNDDLFFAWTTSGDVSNCSLQGGNISNGGNVGTSKLQSSPFSTQAIQTGDYTLTCVNPNNQSASSSIQVNVSCVPSGDDVPWGGCLPECSQTEQGTQKRIKIRADCTEYTEEQACTIPKCYSTGFKEVN